MGNGMNKIVNGLYLGSLKDSRDATQLREHRIQRIISLLDGVNVATPTTNGEDEITVLKIKVADAPSENIAQHFSTCNEFIHRARLDNQAVLVHCAAGVSRSVSIVCAYVMTVTRLGCEDVLKAIRGSRKIANPNAGFHKQLRDYERSQRIMVERARLQAIFGADLDKFEVPDIIMCNQLIQEFGRFVISQLKRQQSAQGGQLVSINAATDSSTRPENGGKTKESVNRFEMRKSLSHTERSRTVTRERGYRFIDEEEDAGRPWLAPVATEETSDDLPITNASSDSTSTTTTTTTTTTVATTSVTHSSIATKAASSNYNGSLARSALIRCTCPPENGSFSAIIDNTGTKKWFSLPRSQSVTSECSGLPARNGTATNVLPSASNGSSLSRSPYLTCTCYCTCSNTQHNASTNGANASS